MICYRGDPEATRKGMLMATQLHELQSLLKAAHLVLRLGPQPSEQCVPFQGRQSFRGHFFLSALPHYHFCRNHVWPRAQQTASSRQAGEQISRWLQMSVFNNRPATVQSTAYPTCLLATSTDPRPALIGRINLLALQSGLAAYQLL